MSRRALIVVLVLVLVILAIIAIYYFGFYLPRYHGGRAVGSAPPSPSTTAPSPVIPPGEAGAPRAPLTICSFNIKWLGHYKDKANADLAFLLRDCDAVVVQELVATPVAVAFPEG